MNEALVVNLFLTVRVLLVGGILLVLPSIVRRDMLFGTHIRKLSDDDTARRLVLSWRKGCLAAMGVALLTGWSISWSGWPVAGNLIGTGVLLIAALGNYLCVYQKTRSLVQSDVDQHNQDSVASLTPPDPRATMFARITLGICVVAGVATLLFAAFAYRSMPPSVPSLISPLGAEGLHNKSLVAVLFAPALGLVFNTFIAFVAVCTSMAKRSLRSGDGTSSVKTQDDFRSSMANLTSWTALFLCLFTSLLSIQMSRVGLSQIDSIGIEVALVAVGLIIFAVVNLIRIFRKFGQGGALQEAAADIGTLGGGLADNSRWVYGLFYVDRNDPSVMVEKRFGFGYTFNYGNPIALWVVSIFMALMLALCAAAVIEFLL